MFPKIGVGNHPFVHRVFHEINHPFWWGFSPYFWFNTQVQLFQGIVTVRGTEPALLEVLGPPSRCNAWIGTKSTLTPCHWDSYDSRRHKNLQEKFEYAHGFGEKICHVSFRLVIFSCVRNVPRFDTYGCFQKRGGGRAPVQFPYKTLFSRKSTKSFNVKNKSSQNHKAILYNSSTFRQ